MRICQESTSKRVRLYHASLQSWRVLCQRLNYPESFAPTLSKVSRREPGCISGEVERDLRRRLGIAWKKIDRIPIKILAQQIRERREMR